MHAALNRPLATPSRHRPTPWRKIVRSLHSGTVRVYYRPTEFGLIATALNCGIVIVYCWLISAGRMTSCTLHGGTSVYGMLADAFLHGHTYLLVEPDPTLLSLPDPYNPAEAGPYWAISTDLSFHGGKYYTYFGSVPALIAAPLVWTGMNVTDAHLVLAFLSGGLVFSTLLIRAIRRRLVP